jgi:anti-sigma B factor antagonist
VFSRDDANSTPRVVAVEAFDAHGAAIVVDGDLDLETSSQLETALVETIAKGHRHLVIDLSAATFLDSTAMGKLLTSIGPLRDEPAAAVVLVGAQGIVERSLAISGIDQMFSSFDTREAAIGHLGGGPEPLRDQWRSIIRSAS